MTGRIQIGSMLPTVVLALCLPGFGCGGAPEIPEGSREVTLQGKDSQGGGTAQTSDSNQRTPDDVAADPAGAQDDGDGDSQQKQGSLCADGYEQCGCGEDPDHGGSGEDHGQNQGGSDEGQSGGPDDDYKGPCCCAVEAQP